MKEQTYPGDEYYEDYLKWIDGNMLDLFDKWMDIHRDLDIRFEDFEKYLEDNNIEDEFEEFAIKEFELSKQNVQ